ncbi:MAG: DUF6316 family protein [Thioalkalispiraceae bacterium]|jgi:hypothetical protein
MDTRLNRQGESGVTPFRSGRFFVVANQWYFATREGIDKGPYTTRSNAQLALDDFLEQCEKVNRLFN